MFCDLNFFPISLVLSITNDPITGECDLGELLLARLL